MAVAKRIVILANSVKHDPGRCIAGREVSNSIDGQFQLGSWIRPVSTIGEGELLHEHMQVANGGSIGVLDIFEVSLLSRTNDPSQPENWIINSKIPWNRVAQWPVDQLGKLAEAPADLWLQPPPMRPDRTTPSYVQAHPPQQSLYVIVLPQARLYRNQWKKYRLTFDHAGTFYDLGVTDPSVHGRLSGQTDIALAAPTVCVSLAPAFKGYHYKVAATIIW